MWGQTMFVHWWSMVCVDVLRLFIFNPSWLCNMETERAPAQNAELRGWMQYNNPYTMGQHAGPNTLPPYS